MSLFRIVPAGDSAIVVEFEERIDLVINARAIALAAALKAAQVAGVRDIVPTYRSVALYFDPLRTNYDALVELVERNAGDAVPEAARQTTVLRIPVCYGGEFGPDLADVAEFGGIKTDEVVALHAAPTLPCVHARLRSRVRVHGRR